MYILHLNVVVSLPLPQKNHIQDAPLITIKDRDQRLVLNEKELRFLHMLAFVLATREKHH